MSQTIFGLQPDEALLLTLALPALPAILFFGRLLLEFLGWVGWVTARIVEETLVLLLRPVVWALEWGAGLGVWLAQSLWSLVRPSGGPVHATVRTLRWEVSSGVSLGAGLAVAGAGAGAGVAGGPAGGAGGVGGVVVGAAGARGPTIAPRAVITDPVPTAAVIPATNETVGGETPAPVSPPVPTETWANERSGTDADAPVPTNTGGAAANETEPVPTVATAPTPRRRARATTETPGTPPRRVRARPSHKTPAVCAVCGQPLPGRTTGRPRRFCSDRCRWRAWAAQQKSGGSR